MVVGRIRWMQFAGGFLLLPLLGLGFASCAVEPSVDSVERAAPSAVLAGLDVIQRDGNPLFEDAAIGLVVHGASMTRDGTHAIDVFLQRGYDLRRLFSPEHGLRGTAAAGEKVADGIDPDSGLPVVSFYGPRLKPEEEHLADLDVLVIDLQDVGVRFYTYVSTMLLSAQAGLESGLDVVILDRPNPLGGRGSYGPIRDPGIPLSMVSRAPGPLVHGLTIGEIARVAYPEARAVDVTSTGRMFVVPMEGWHRQLRWADTGLTWRNPSPNLRSAQAAQLYPATALLEGTNVSEGRGTEAPFLIIGAPWFDDELLADLEDLFVEYEVATSRVEFTPTASAAALRPKYEGELCLGLVLAPENSSFDQYALGLRVLLRLAQHEKFALLREGRSLTWLLGSPSATEVVLGGLSLEDHLNEVALEDQQWRARQAGALLYE